MATRNGDIKIKGSTTLKKQTTTPSNPNAGELKVYAKTDDKLYKLTSAGVETEVGSGSGGASAVSDLTDVELTSLADNEVLQYDATAMKWKNVDASSIVGGEFVPIGTVSAFYGTTIPNGWLLCNGSTFNGTTYPDLSSFLGSTTLPDLRGYFLRGLDTAGTVDTDGIGRTVGSVQQDAFQGHWHQGSASGTTSPFSTWASALSASQFNGDDRTMGYNPKSDSVNGVPRTSSETRPKNIVVNYIIKASHTPITAYQVVAGAGISITNDTLNGTSTIAQTAVQSPTDTIETVVSNGSTIAMTGSSAIVQEVVGSTTQTFTLPDATLMLDGTKYTFINNGEYPCNIIIKPFLTNQLIGGNVEFAVKTKGSSVTVITEQTKWVIQNTSKSKIIMPKLSSNERTKSLQNFFIYDKQVYCMGSNHNGSLGRDDIMIPTIRSMVDSSGNSITAFKDVITGYDGTLFLTEDGRVFETGSLVTTNYIPTQKIFPVGTVIDKIFAPSGRYASGSVSFFALSTTGELYSWGNNAWGQLGIGNTTSQTIPQLVQGDITGKVITDVSVSGNNGMHIACIDNTGQLYTWGYNDNAYGGNALGIAGLSGYRTTPFAVPLMTNIVKVVAAGLFHNVTGEVNMTRVIKADGTSWASGRGTAGALANGSTADSSVFIQENQGYADIVDIFASNCYPAVPQAIIRSNGFVYFAGRRINQAFGDGLADGDLTSFTNTAQLNSAGFQGKMIANGNGIIPKVRIGGDADGNTFTVVLDNTGTLWACGKNNVGQCGVGLNADPITVFSKCTIPTNVPVVDFRTSGSSNDGAGIIALLQDGSMFSCGYNNYGSLGNLHTTSTAQNIFFRPLIGFEPNSKN